MKNTFEIAGGTVKGKIHKLDGKNNQDAYSFYTDEDVVIGLVADGCGSGANSEVGARLAVRMIGEMLRAYAKTGGLFYPDCMEEIRLGFIEKLKSLAQGMGGSFSRVVVDYFLFTLVGFLVTKERTAVFSLGDGVQMINGEIRMLGPFPGNAPPYIAYGITSTSLGQDNPELLKFKIDYLVNTEDVECLLVGTDGVNDLIRSSKKKMPNKETPVGDLSQFWSDDIYFRNQDKVRRQLSMINADSFKYLRNRAGAIVEVKKENGLLPDDTTLIVARRKRSLE